MNRNTIKRVPSPAIVVAVLALLAALGGVAYAAAKVPKNSVSAKQIKDGSVTGTEVQNGSLGTGDFAPGVLAAGPQGPQGPEGPRGASAVGPARGVFRDGSASIASTTVTPGGASPIATMSALEPGTWAITAKTVIAHQLGATITCYLQSPATGGGDMDTATVFNGGTTNTVSMQILHTVPAAGHSVGVGCAKNNGFPATASFTKIQAIKVSSATNISPPG